MGGCVVREYVYKENFDVNEVCSICYDDIENKTITNCFIVHHPVWFYIFGHNRLFS